MKTVLNIAGKSGSGKTYIAEYISNVYGIPMVESYTTRPPRTRNEKGHMFISDVQYDSLENKDKIAHTTFGGYKYCSMLSDLKELNTYVIDEDGINYMQKNFKGDFNIYNLWIGVKDEVRIDGLNKEFGVSSAIKRINRDYGKFGNNGIEYDYIVKNNRTKAELEHEVDRIIKDITEKLK